LAISSSRFFGGALVSSVCSSLSDTAAMSSAAAKKHAFVRLRRLSKAAHLAHELQRGRVDLLVVTGGSKLNSVLMFPAHGVPSRFE
jgi:hypothetical protein